MRLIDEDEAFKVLSAYYKHRTPVQNSALHDALSRVPTVDAVPVVRCEQCTWWNMGECMFWAGDGMYTEYYDYCSRGKREEDDTDQKD